VVGRAALLAAMRRNPLYRALRVDKMTLAALDAVLADHQTGHATREVPILRMLAAEAGDVRRRAEAFAAGLGGLGASTAVEVVDGVSAVGGGAAPGVEVPTALVRLVHAALSADSLAEALRRQRPAVVARVLEDAVVLDLRTVSAEEEAALRAAVLRACAAGA
jgi:L-seryl-tRNA(Ser) seleniumtransferase